MKKLKRFTIDNIIALILSFLIYIGSAYFITFGILIDFKILWFFIFFISFTIFMYNLFIIIRIKNIGYHIKRDIDELKNNNKEV